MTRTFLILLFGFYTASLFAQKVVDVSYPVEGNIILDKDVVLPKINNGYTLWLLEKDATKGLIVFTRSRRDTVNTDFLIDYALENQLAVLYATTNNRLEFFFENEKMQEIENYIYEVVIKYKIPKENLMYCGMSLEGTRALKLAQFGQSKTSKYKLKPKAITICDAPLDMVRFYKEGVKAAKIKFNPIAADEGRWVSNYLAKNFGGTPNEVLDAYLDYSPYSYYSEDSNALYPFLDIAIRAYTEPDVAWWMKTRRKDYYGINALDMAAFINELNILCNANAELVVTQNKGYYPDGTRHPHNWNIVDEKEMIDWFLTLIN